MSADHWRLLRYYAEPINLALEVDAALESLVLDLAKEPLASHPLAGKTREVLEEIKAAK